MITKIPLTLNFFWVVYNEVDSNESNDINNLNSN